MILNVNSELVIKRWVEWGQSTGRLKSTEKLRVRRQAASKRDRLRDGEANNDR